MLGSSAITLLVSRTSQELPKYQPTARPQSTILAHLLSPYTNTRPDYYAITYWHANSKAQSYKRLCYGLRSLTTASLVQIDIISR